MTQMSIALCRWCVVGVGVDEVNRWIDIVVLVVMCWKPTVSKCDIWKKLYFSYRPIFNLKNPKSKTGLWEKLASIMLQPSLPLLAVNYL